MKKTSKPNTQKPAEFFARCASLPFIEMRSAHRSAACYQTHSHDEFSFGVIDTGSAKYHNLKQANKIHQGTTVTINPGDAHSCNPDAGEWSYRMLFIDTDWIGELQSELFNSNNQDYLAFNQVLQSNPSLFTQFDCLFKQLRESDNKLAAETLLIEYLKTLFGKDLNTQSDLKALDNFHIHRVKELIMDQLDSPWSLDDFCAETGLSRYHLIRSFKQQYGQAPHAYQLNQRINRAKQLLQQGNGLAETALELGFADQSHFQRHFKKRVAVTPKSYQSFFVGAGSE